MSVDTLWAADYNLPGSFWGEVGGADFGSVRLLEGTTANSEPHSYRHSESVGTHKVLICARWRSLLGVDAKLGPRLGGVTRHPLVWGSKHG
jgi:hypothetical protein